MEFLNANMVGAGVWFFNTGTAVWKITEGIIPGLESFKTSVEIRMFTSDRPGSPAWLFENPGKMRGP
jgi:hypothetical protein